MASLLRLYRERISVKIFIFATIFIVSICLTFFIVFIYHQRASIKDKLVREGKLLVELLAYNSRLGVYSESKRLLESSIEAVLKRKNVFLVAIFDGKGKLITQKSIEMDQVKISTLFTVEQDIRDVFTTVDTQITSTYFETKETFRFWAPVVSSFDYSRQDTLLINDVLPRKNNLLIGYVHISIDKKDLDKEQKALIYKSLALGLVFLFVGLIMAYLGSETITRPIKELTQGVRNYGTAGTFKDPPSHLKDEIGELSNSFKEMGQLVLKRTNELNNTVFSLQNEVIQRKRAEDAVTELNKTLEIRVKEEIRKQREQEKLLIQQSKLAAMGEMISAIAHQWRQPINALSILAMDIQDAYEYNELDKEYLINYTKKASEQIQFMSKTIDDFRSFFKPSKEKENCNVLEVVDETMSMFSEQLKYNNILCDIKYRVNGNSFGNLSDVYSSNELITYTYRNELKQVILIVVSNSKDAITDQRQKGLKEASENGLISIDITSDDGKIILTISDNGGGIPEKIIDRIFEPYFTTKFQSQGTGIGLYMAKVIIENNMNGSIYAENIEHGAKFIIMLDKITLAPA
ncbi:MAG: HAMP domain-containing protein [Nitrospirae bacterium]|nr:HAMP domain-containing protein [Nitrospirota bacterium]